jgi:uracil-DNA glycosylase family protein
MRPQAAVVATDETQPRTLAELNARSTHLGSQPLVEGATQAVLGEGPVGAHIALVGEQPGDQEDLRGRPFVGPAGKLLDRALEEAGINRKRSYLTNAVKHFKFEERGKRRLHKKPSAGEVRHYRWWLKRELEIVHPRVVVALGATAVLALVGKPLAIGRFRGPAHFEGWAGYITVHPSSMLRLPDQGARDLAFKAFVAGLQKANAPAEAGR